MNKIIVILLMIGSSVIVSFGALFLKKGSHNFHIHITIKNIIQILKNYYLISGIFLYVLASIIFINILRTQELSFAYPLSSISYIFTTIISVYYLKEKMNKYKLVGIISIICGVILITL